MCRRVDVDLRYCRLPGRRNDCRSAAALTPEFAPILVSDIRLATQRGIADDPAEYGGFLDVRQASQSRAQSAPNERPPGQQHPPCSLITGR